MNKETELQNEIDRLRTAIQRHHDVPGPDRCWLDDNELYQAAGLTDHLGLHDNRVGDKGAMLENCIRFVVNRTDEGGPWRSYQELLDENGRLRGLLSRAASACGGPDAQEACRAVLSILKEGESS